MASSSADCVFGGVRLISSASMMLPKIGPSHERPGAAAGGRVLLDDVGAGDVGRHQIRGELDAPELQTQRLGDGAHQQRLRGSRKTGDQAVAADEQRDQHLFEHFFLADDDAPDLLDDVALGLLEADDALFQFRRVERDRGGISHYSSAVPQRESSSNSFCAGLNPGAASSASNNCSLASSIRFAL